MSINITFISVSIYIGCTFLMSERLYPFIIYQCKMYANLYKSVTKHPSIDRESSYFEEISLDMGIVKIRGGVSLSLNIIFISNKFINPPPDK